MAGRSKTKKKPSRPAPTERRRLERWRPTHAVALYLVMLVVALLAVRQVGSLDVGFHLKAGESILSGNGWPVHDTFSYTYNDHLYVDTSWGYQVVLATVHGLAGASGLVVLHAALVVALFALVAFTTRLAPHSPTVLLSALLLGGLGSELRFEVRPEVFSYVLLAVVLHLLHRYAEGRTSPVWAVPVIFLVWVNVHALFILGWIALGCFLVGLTIRDRRPDRRLLAVTVASLAVALVNPYGWRGVVFPFTLATRLRAENVFGQSIGEFVSPFALGLSEQFPFYPRLSILSFRVLVLVSVLTLIPLIRQRRHHCVALWIVFVPLSIQMIRNIPVFAVACLPGLVWGVSPTVLTRSRVRTGRIVLAGLMIATAALGLRVTSDAHYVGNRRVDRFGLGWNSLAIPTEAASYLREATPPGRILNHLNFGGYLMWSLDEPVFIDGRLEVVGERFFEHYRQILASEAKLESAVARYGIGSIVFPYRANPRLLRRLSDDPRWRLAWADPVAAVFVRSESPAPSWRPGPVEPVAAGSLPGIAGNSRPSRLRRWISGLWGRREFPVRDHYLGLLHYFRGELEPAGERFARAIRDSGGLFYETYNNLGAVAFRTGELELARDCYRVVLDEDPGNERARRRLERIEESLASLSALETASPARVVDRATFGTRLPTAPFRSKLRMPSRQG